VVLDWLYSSDTYHDVSSDEFLSGLLTPALMDINTNPVHASAR
jgi:hypothetical protein